jgi:hypothetical protein
MNFFLSKSIITISIITVEAIKLFLRYKTKFNIWTDIEHNKLILNCLIQPFSE